MQYGEVYYIVLYLCLCYTMFYHYYVMLHCLLSNNYDRRPCNIICVYTCTYIYIYTYTYTYVYIKLHYDLCRTSRYLLRGALRKSEADGVDAFGRHSSSNNSSPIIVAILNMIIIANITIAMTK